MKTNPIRMSQRLRVIVDGVTLYTSRFGVRNGLFGSYRHERAFECAINAIEMNPTKCVGWSSTLTIDNRFVTIQVDVQ